MSAFKDRLTDLLNQRGVSGLPRMKAESAITSLLQVIGDVPMSEAKEDGLGAIFTLPDDDKYLYIAVGVYSDGTFDIVKEGSFRVEDRLMGWKPGQSRKDYEKELDLENPPPPKPSPEEEKETRRPTTPQPPARACREQEPRRKKSKQKERRAD
jgi:hypothetical protein